MIFFSLTPRGSGHGWPKASPIPAEHIELVEPKKVSWLHWIRNVFKTRQKAFSLDFQVLHPPF